MMIAWLLKLFGCGRNDPCEEDYPPMRKKVPNYGGWPPIPIKMPAPPIGGTILHSASWLAGIATDTGQPVKVVATTGTTKLVAQGAIASPASLVLNPEGKCYLYDSQGTELASMPPLSREVWFTGTATRANVTEAIEAVRALLSDYMVNDFTAQEIRRKLDAIEDRAKNLP